MRLPAQIHDPRNVAEVVAVDSLAPLIRVYAQNLCDMMVGAWQAANHASLQAQAETVENTSRTKDGAVSFAVGDRACRPIPGHANKLAFLWAGPYRVEKVFPAGRYRLRDLENQQIRDQVHVTNLRKYFTVVDLQPLHADEYIVDALIGSSDKGTG